MKAINYHNRYFMSVQNAGSGEVDADTVSHYRQQNDVVWATYEGGAIKFGTLTGLVLPDSTLAFRYQHVNDENDIMTGTCQSTPEILQDGRIRLHEAWQWTSGDRSTGESIIEESMP